MIQVTKNYLAAQKAGNRVVLLGFFQSRMGRRVYAFQTPTAEQMGSSGGVITFNGEHQIGDGTMYGSQAIILDWGALMVNFGNLRETLSPEGSNLLLSFTGEEISGITSTLNNSTRHFSDVLAVESFLNQTYLIRQGFVGLIYTDFITLFKGIITKETLTDTECIVEAQTT